MLSFLFSLVAATTLPSCDAVDSCLGQVNGTLPLREFIPTLANGGVGFTFTTSNCIDGTLALSESCMCGTKTMYNSASYQGYCYHGLVGVHNLVKHDHAFCANQFGLIKNTFFPMNATKYLRCHCFDSATGITELAHLGKPLCTNGFAYYEDCNVLDGTDANTALLAPYTGAKLAAMKLLFPHHSQHNDRLPACQCGEYTACRAPTATYRHNKPYCQYLAEVCTSVKECGVDAWQPTGIYDDDGCACGDETCEHGEICEFEDKAGKMKHACSWTGQASGMIVKTSKDISGTAMVFSLLVFICALCACIIAVVTYCKARKI
jgi:hypothetical protein